MRRKSNGLFLLRIGAALLASGGPGFCALAQSAAPTAKPQTIIPDKQHMGPVTPPPHDGVIAPKHNTDPDMTKKPPPQNPAETPVIPPSATPGGKEAK